MASELTTIALERLKPGSKRREIPDGRVGSLYFTIQPSGKRSWCYRYRIPGDPCKRKSKLTIGSYPAIGLREARAAAIEAKCKVEQGKDPSAEKKASRAVAPPASDLIEDVAAQFVSHYARRQLKASTAYEVERILAKDIVGPWHGRRLSQIRRPDIHDLLDEIIKRGSPVAANRTLSWLRRMCGWAVERELIETSPCAGIRAPTAETS